MRFLKSSLPVLWCLASLGTAVRAAEGGAAGASFVGHAVCQDCHQAEHDVWKETKHSTGFRTVHRSAVAAKVLEAVGGEKNIRNHPTCAVCHFVSEPSEGGAKAGVTAGVSCERCHGAASAWVGIHNKFGGPREEESAEHRIKRIADAKKAGMLRPDMLYDIGSNCMSCHGLANPAVEPAVFAKMLAAGHPFDPDFELVRYSQGSVRHRFYPPTPTVNAEMTPVEQARLFAVGQAAKLVSASAAAARGDDAAYKAAQAKRVEASKTALAALKSVPEAAGLAAEPTEANARKFVAAIEGKDLTGELKGLLPAKADLK